MPLLSFTKDSIGFCKTWQVYVISFQCSTILLLLSLCLQQVEHVLWEIEGFRREGVWNRWQCTSVTERPSSYLVRESCSQRGCVQGLILRVLCEKSWIIHLKEVQFAGCIFGRDSWLMIKGVSTCDLHQVWYLSPEESSRKQHSLWLMCWILFFFQDNCHFDDFVVTCSAAYAVMWLLSQ